MSKSRKLKTVRPLKLLIKLLLTFLSLHTLVRIIRYFYQFPIPEQFLKFIDHPLRRKLQPSDRIVLELGIREGMQVLEIGPGNGRYTLAAARRVGKEGKVITIDIELKVIERIQRLVENSNAGNLEAQEANVHTLPFEDNTFDLIYMIAVIGEIPQPQKAFREFARVLKPDGKLVFNELLPDPDYKLLSTLSFHAESVGMTLQRKEGGLMQFKASFVKSDPMPNAIDISPVGRPKEAAGQYYDKLSSIYDILAASEKKFVQMGIGLLNVKPGETVLELGCGSGFALTQFAQAVGENGFVCGIDVSEKMLKQAAKRLEKVDDICQVELKQTDASQPVGPDYKFDKIFSSFTLELFELEEILNVLRNCKQTLKPGGKLAFVCLSKSEIPQLPEKIYEWFHYNFSTAVDCRPIYVRKLLKSNGFNILEHHRHKMWGLPVDIILAEIDRY